MAKMKDRILGEVQTELIFFVNGKKVVEQNPNPEWTLLYYLRKKLKLCGTKLGCAEGGCGACTVMVSKYNRHINEIIHLAVNACLAPVCAMHGLAVTTVEGIGSTKTKLHPVQERIAKSHGSQCGFCTPGIVMSMYSLLRSSTKKIEYEDMEVAFQGNLCRCTGYRPIIEGYKTFLEEWEHIYVNNMNDKISSQSNGYSTHNGLLNGTCSLGKNCCKNKSLNSKEDIFQKSSFTPYDVSQEPIFPPELKISDALDMQTLIFKGPLVTWFRPSSLIELLQLKQEYPGAKIVVGNSEVGVEMKFKHAIYPVIVTPTSVPELNNIKETNEGLIIGASVTLSDMEAAMKKQIAVKPEYQTRAFKEIIDMLNWFAGKQIRNVAAVGGNIMTGSPISDLNPIFMALNVTLNLASENGGKRSIKMDENFFVGYRKNTVKENEILCSILVPYTDNYRFVKAYKQAKRRDDDIAIVNIAVDVTFNSNTNIIKQMRMAFGGMAPTTVLSTKTCAKAIGKKWEDSLLDDIYDSLIKELPLNPSAPGGMIQYRRSLTMSLFYKAFLAITKNLSENLKNKCNIPSTHLSGIDMFHASEPKNAQYFEIVEDGKFTDGISKTIPHLSGTKQASGEAVYTDDMPSIDGEVYLAFVLSTKAHANIVSLDATDALSEPGVIAFFSANDVDEYCNSVGAVLHDEEVFLSNKVTSQGQTIGVIIADDQITAQRAARKVKVVYEEIQPIIVSIEDAIKHNSFIKCASNSIIKGNVNNVFKNAEHIIEGECRMGGQEHFYFETNCAYAVPRKEDDEMEVFCSTQHPSEIAKLIAHFLGVPINRIAVRVKRLGGGFGGKESRAMLVALPVAFAAHRLNRPVRCMLDRDEDMLMTGTRHPFLIKYKVAFTNEGKLTALWANVYNNAGYSLDLSGAVCERALFHIENAYFIPNVEVNGFVCKTNLPSNTAFRGFGGPQGMFAAENFIREIAAKLNKTVEDVQRINLYKEGDLTHYNQPLIECNLDLCWKECVEKSNFIQRNEGITIFNRQNRWRKRGLSIVPTKFGIAFTTKFLNQAGALINVYVDGSVLVSHGGVEMGQGLHTKMIQVASRTLGIEPSKIHIVETAMDKVPNTSATAASAGSDLNGMAILNACTDINSRLQPFKDKNPTGTWKDWVADAYLNRVSLSATGFYATPGIGYDFKTNSGLPFNYFTFGVACSEVEIDCLTGDHQVLRSDIVMDLGNSLNPAIDVGQVEGGFMQGYGLFTIEELIYSPTGTLYSRGPGAYKIPGFSSIPVEFNVSLLKGVSNPRAVYSSKAVGEPPLFLASSVFFAIKEAIKSAREDVGISKTFKLEAPATSARIRMACEDHITAKLDEPKPGTFVPWNIVP